MRKKPVCVNHFAIENNRSNWSFLCVFGILFQGFWAWLTFLCFNPAFVHCVSLMSSCNSAFHFVLSSQHNESLILVVTTLHMLGVFTLSQGCCVSGGKLCVGAS